MTDARALVAALVTVTAWGSAFVAIREAGKTLSPGSLALGRLLGSLVVLGAAAAIRREPLPKRGDLLRISVFGFLWLGVYSVSLNAAERRVDAGTAAMLINIGPILIAILAGVFLREGFPPWLLRLASLAYLIPVVAILLGWAVLGETPPELAVVGGLLCLAGVAIARRRQPLTRQAASPRRTLV